MSVALRTITRLQDADDIAVTLGAGVDEYALCWDNDTAKFVLRAMSGGGVTDHGALTGLADDDHTQYLLATGARTGANSQAQAFTSGIIGPTWKPATDSTTALQLQNAAGTAVVTVDTSNGLLYVPSPSATGRAYLAADGLYITTNGSTFNSVKMSSLDLRFNARDSTRLYSNNVQWMVGNAEVISFTGAGGGMSIIGAAIRGFNNLGVQAADNRFTVTIKQNGNASGTANVLNVQTQSGGAALSVDVSGKTGFGLSAPDSLLHAQLDDAATNAASQLLTLSHNTSGTAAAGYGSRVLWELESSTTADQTAAALDVSWYDATHATRKADLVLTAYDSGGEREGLRIRGNGSAAAIGFFGTAPAERPTGVAVSAAGIHAALVTLGLITA